MKEQTSITPSEDRQPARIHARDLDLLNQAADRLNIEAEDVLEYQPQNEFGESLRP